MTAAELKKIKQRINNTLKKRSGEGDVSMFASLEYDLPEIDDSTPITSEMGQKTIDLLLNIVGRDENREYYPELGTGVLQGGEIPTGFNYETINRICDELDADADDIKRRGGFRGYNKDGEWIDVPGGIGCKEKEGSGEYKASTGTESTHCAAACTGLCLASCIGMCNGCLGCTSCSATCTAEGKGIASGLIRTY